METQRKTRGRAAAEHTKREGRETRDQQIDNEEFDESFLFEDTGALPKIKPRPGMAQYWARIRRGEEVDARNMLRMKRRGWRPRDAGSVPKAYQGLTVQDESLGGIISTHDLVLMERPMSVQKKVQAHLKQVTDDRTKAVRGNIFRDHRNLGGEASGYSRPEREDRATVERGVLLDD